MAVAQAQQAAAGRGAAAGRARPGRRAGACTRRPTGGAVLREFVVGPRPERLLVGPAEPPVPRPGAVPARPAVGGTGRRGPRRGHVRVDRREAARGVRAEANAVLAAYDCAVTVLYHDTEVQKVQTWQSADGPLVLDPVGGGGTSHACVFDWIDRAGSTRPASSA